MRCTFAKVSFRVTQLGYARATMLVGYKFDSQHSKRMLPARRQEVNPKDPSKPAAKLWHNELEVSDDEDDRPSRADRSYRCAGCGRLCLAVLAADTNLSRCLWFVLVAGRAPPVGLRSADAMLQAG